MTEQSFIQALINAGICDGKIYPIKAKDSDNYPYCVYSVIRNTLTDTVERSIGKRNRYLFTSWHDDYVEAVQTLQLFDDTIGDLQMGYSVSGAVIDKDPNTDKWRLTNNDWSVLET